MKKIILILLITITLTGCAGYKELNNLSIVTAVAFDKKEDNYELSFLIANSPKAQTSSKEGEAKTTVYSSEGKTIAEAAKKIEQIVPKDIDDYDEFQDFLILIVLDAFMWGSFSPRAGHTTTTGRCPGSAFA